MPEVAVAPPFVPRGPAPYAAPNATSTSDVASELQRPGDLGLWVVNAQLGKETEITWREDHLDEALYVLSGTVSVDGVPCPPETAIGLEAGAPAHLVALDDAQVVHFGTDSDGADPAETSRSGVHIVGPGPRSSNRSELGGCTVTNGYFFDSTCPTCSVTLFHVDGDGAYVGGSHSHSQNELIHVLSGELRVGPLTVEAGATIGVPGDRRYSFRTKAPFAFLNYRPALSTYASRERGTRIETSEGYAATGARDLRIAT